MATHNINKKRALHRPAGSLFHLPRLAQDDSSSREVRESGWLAGRARYAYNANPSPSSSTDKQTDRQTEGGSRVESEKCGGAVCDSNKLCMLCLRQTPPTPPNPGCPNLNINKHASKQASKQKEMRKHCPLLHLLLLLSLPSCRHGANLSHSIVTKPQI